jgi:hypothetical protein
VGGAGAADSGGGQQSFPVGKFALPVSKMDKEKTILVQVQVCWAVAVTMTLAMMHPSHDVEWISIGSVTTQLTSTGINHFVVPPVRIESRNATVGYTVIFAKTQNCRYFLLQAHFFQLGTFFHQYFSPLFTALLPL